ncbi:DUF1580 domain-containing protein [Tautonia marina]|uniref:DUF1580 domain-containing protein n=1 Tax=Tautonia marina TaxID=2653855 RepID=UPI0036F3AE6A
MIALADVPGILPKRRGGRKVHTSTVWRWAMKGYRGTRLETLRVGGTLCTSREALERFFGRIDTDPGSEPTSGGSGRAREIRDAVARAETMLRPGSKRRAPVADVDAVGAVSVSSRAKRGARS